MQTALITGASGGLGLELARLAAADGYRLILTARSENKLIEVAKDLSTTYAVETHVFKADLSDEKDVQALIDFTEEKNLEVSMLINNAGFGDYGLFHETDFEKESRMIMLNIHALTRLTKHFLPAMMRRKSGYIMNVSSVAAFQPGPYMSVYYATKAYVLSLSEAIASEVKDDGVKVSAFCPGPTDTGFVDAANLNDSKLFKLMKAASAAKVALYGYKALLKGKSLAVPGLTNKLMITFVRFMPRKWVTASVKMVSKKA